MSTSPENNQEIDLSEISKKIGAFIENFTIWVFKGILFLKKHSIVIAILFFLGVGIGFYLDRNSKSYDNQIIVNPNYETADYLYAKIDLINSKINEGDSIFLQKTVGIKEPKFLNEIKVEPILDIYKFINNSDKNFEFVKLLGEDGDIKKIVGENLTSKNYPYHIIKFSTAQKTNYDATVKPILAFLNSSNYYKKIQTEYIKNVKVKIVANDSIIKQIDGMLNSFSATGKGSQHNDKLIYYNENTQLNDIIETKDKLIAEQSKNTISLLNLDEIIKENSSTLNVRNVKAINGKRKLILPFIFIGLFVILIKLRNYYKHQMSKL